MTMNTLTCLQSYSVFLIVVTISMWDVPNKLHFVTYCSLGKNVAINMFNASNTLQCICCCSWGNNVAINMLHVSIKLQCPFNCYMGINLVFSLCFVLYIDKNGTVCMFDLSNKLQCVSSLNIFINFIWTVKSLWTLRYTCIFESSILIQIIIKWFVLLYIFSSHPFNP